MGFTMTQVHQLYKLQETDLEIREKKARLSEVLTILKGPAWLQKAEAQAQAAAAEYQALQSQHQALNLERQSLRTRIKSSENRLYSGKVHNPKELSDLQSEIDSLGRRVSTLEDEMLEVMILMEDAEAAQTEADAGLAKAEARWQKESVELQTEKNELAVRLNKLLALRQEQAQVVDAASMKEYEALAKKKGGTAVVRVRGEMCLGCRTTISTNKLREARQGIKAYCGSCGRILYPY